MTLEYTIKIPATSANLGSGFDSIGLAIDLWNFVTIKDGPFQINLKGYGEDELPNDSNNLVYQSFSRLFQEIGKSVPEVSMECENNIPVARGLGSSSAALVGGLYLANIFADNPLNQSDLLDLAAQLEGHPDNVAPAILGGIQIGIYDNQSLITSSVSYPPNISLVLFIPDSKMSTDSARNILGENVPRKDAVFNLGRFGLLVNSFSKGDLTNLKYATQDLLHQPQRQKIFFPMKNIIKGALDAGAYGAFLSGAGSTVMAITDSREYTIGYEMADAAMKSGIEGSIVVSSIVNQGVQLVGQSETKCH
ncbi:MAG: homoserine kinase [Dehalococcoidia bacterium]|tara:strand:- start:3824 stop:4744 length:921 start_codon:yes stop_codon:yes gene_type:complete